MVSVIQGHFDPWHPRLLNKVEAQLDAILESYAETFPDKLKFERKKNRQGIERIEVLSAEWSDKLIGKASEEHKSRISFKLPKRFAGTTAVQEPPGKPQRPVYTPARQMPRINRK